MSFFDPQRLWFLTVVPVLALAYLFAQRRRHRLQSVRYSNLELLRQVAGRRPGWRRHVPAALSAVALVGMIVGLARPAGTVEVPREAATIMLVIDTSASMQAIDVTPSRLEAAIEAAQSFVQQLPPGLEVGLVSFDRQARIEAVPTVDHQAVSAAIGELRLGPGTAAGDALTAALDAINTANAASGTPAGDGGAAIVLLSDGVTTVGRPVTEAAQIAADAGVPVSTIAFGTDRGAVEVQGRIIPVPADPDTMAAVAEITSGTFFEAVSGAQLKKVYEDIGTRVGFETERREVSGPVLGGAAAVLAAGLALGLMWNGRLL